MLRNITPWSRVVIDKVAVYQVVKKFLPCIKPKGLLPCPKEHLTRINLEPLKSDAYLHAVVLSDQL
jgi:hypothetical protein